VRGHVGVVIDLARNQMMAGLLAGLYQYRQQTDFVIEIVRDENEHA
jgi:hypothetical protein